MIYGQKLHDARDILRFAEAKNFRPRSTMEVLGHEKGNISGTTRDIKKSFGHEMHQYIDNNSYFIKYVRKVKSFRDILTFVKAFHF